MIDMQLGEELTNQLEILNNTKENPETKSSIAKFDDMGTLHLRRYNEDGKPIQDLAFKKQYDWQKKAERARYDSDLKAEESQRLKEMSRTNTLIRIGIVGLVFLLAMLTLSVILLIYK